MVLSYRAQAAFSFWNAAVYQPTSIRTCCPESRTSRATGGIERPGMDARLPLRCRGPGGLGCRSAGKLLSDRNRSRNRRFLNDEALATRSRARDGDPLLRLRSEVVTPDRRGS